MPFFSYYLIKIHVFSVINIISQNLNFYSSWSKGKNYLMSKYILRRNKNHHVKKLVTRNDFYQADFPDRHQFSYINWI